MKTWHVESEKKKDTNEMKDTYRLRKRTYALLGVGGGGYI